MPSEKLLTRSVIATSRDLVGARSAHSFWLDCCDDLNMKSEKHFAHHLQNLLSSHVFCSTISFFLLSLHDPAIVPAILEGLERP